MAIWNKVIKFKKNQDCKKIKIYLNIIIFSILKKQIIEL